MVEITNINERPGQYTLAPLLRRHEDGFGSGERGWQPNSGQRGRSEWRGLVAGVPQSGRTGLPIGPSRGSFGNPVSGAGSQ